MPSNEKDTDGLSFPDDATLARLRAEVDPPNPTDWADAMAMLLWAAELERRGERNPALPPGLTAVEYGLRAIVGLLQRQPALMRRGALLPPSRLLAAIGDLAAGHDPPLFQRVKRPRGHPSKPLEEALVMGLAARTVTFRKARLLIPRHMSVAPVASQTRTPDGGAIIDAARSSPVAVSPRQHHTRPSPTFHQAA